MTTLLTISMVLMWILILVLGVVVWALARQIGVLFERVAPAGALMVNASVKAGDPAPEIPVVTLDGLTLTIGGATATRPRLLFFLAPDCPICRSLLPVLKSMSRQQRGLEIILASDGGEPADHEAYVKRHGLERFPYVLSELLGKSYGVSKLPYGVLIREDGSIASLGIVNSREHLESLFEADALGVASIQDYLARDQESPLYVNAAAREN
jgi:methylamine dehydrogenase accessory protein MauD